MIFQELNPTPPLHSTNQSVLLNTWYRVIHSIEDTFYYHTSISNSWSLKKARNIPGKNNFISANNYLSDHNMPERQNYYFHFFSGEPMAKVNWSETWKWVVCIIFIFRSFQIVRLSFFKVLDVFPVTFKPR